MAYEMHTWSDKELITARKLNNIEEGIASLSQIMITANDNHNLNGALYFTNVNQHNETLMLAAQGDVNDIRTAIISKNNNNQLYLREYNISFTAYENYLLPVPDVVDNTNFDIVTTKSSMRPSYINALLQIDPINSTGSDTTQNWAAKKTGIAWYTTTGQLNDQPSQWGYLLNINTTPGGKDVHQIWFTQASGNLFHRGGNNNGWSGSWRRLVDVITLGNVASGSSAEFNLANGRWLIMTGHNSTVAHNGLWIVNMGSDGGRTVINIGGGANITITAASGKITVACTNNGAVTVYALQIAAA